MEVPKRTAQAVAAEEFDHRRAPNPHFALCNDATTSKAQNKILQLEYAE